MRKITSLLLCLCMLASMVLTAGAAEAKPVYVALGDEIAVTAPEGTSPFTQILADAMGYELINCAEAGNTAADVLAQVTGGELNEALASAKVVTLTAGVNDMMNMIFGKVTEAYNEQFDPDIKAEEIFDVLENGNSLTFARLAIVAQKVFNGDPANGVPSFLESKEFSDSIKELTETIKNTSAAIKEINPKATVIVTTHYNPYFHFQGVYAALSSGINTGLQKLNNAIMREKSLRVADVYKAFDEAAMILSVATTEPMNLDFTPNAEGHKLMAECIQKKIPSNPFTDVAERKYFYEPVLWAVERGITSGTSVTTFSPDGPCTREQIVTFLWRAFGSPAPKSTDNPFSDVPADKYYTDAVLWAVENGITSGTSKTTFSPKAVCTREQVVTFLWRASLMPKPESTDNPFSDVAAGKYYTDAVLWAVENGITQGTSATTFGPKDTCTRAQIVTFLFRTLTK